MTNQAPAAAGCLSNHECYTVAMFNFSHVITGLVLVVIGVLFVRFSFQIGNFTGSQDWIESKLGPGTTYGVYKILGVVAAVGGILYATGLSDPVLGWLLTPLINMFRAGN